MATQLPSRRDLKCAGCSFVFAQILLLFAAFMYCIDYDAYAVKTEEEVIALHNVVSSPRHRIETEISVAAIWLAYPFLLIGLFGIKKFFLFVHENQPGEMFAFTAIQSYTIFIAVICVIVPALALTTSAFEWSFHEYTGDAKVVPTGYYIQFYLIVFTNELIDCVAIADAGFIISMCIVSMVSNPWFVEYFYGSKFKKKFKTILDPSLPKCLQNMKCFILFWAVVHTTLTLSLLVVFCLVLFEFAESGFLCPNGKAKFLLVWSFILKILLGRRMIKIGASSRYDALQKLFADEGPSRNMLSEAAKASYKSEMNEITIAIEPPVVPPLFATATPVVPSL